MEIVLIYAVYDFNWRIADSSKEPAVVQDLCQRLESLDRSRRGHLSNITKVCNALDESVKDFGNVVKVRTRQTQLNTAFCVCCDNYDDLLDTSCEKYQCFE